MDRATAGDMWAHKGLHNNRSSRFTWKRVINRVVGGWSDLGQKRRETRAREAVGTMVEDPGASKNQYASLAPVRVASKNPVSCMTMKCEARSRHVAATSSGREIASTWISRGGKGIYWLMAGGMSVRLSKMCVTGSHCRPQRVAGKHD